MLLVCPYSTENLKSLLVRCSAATQDAVNSKSHTCFLADYLNELQAKTIVVEGPYTDHDYLDDYGHYYLRCFRDIKKTTHRIHFFGSAFSESSFKDLLHNSSPEERSGTLGEYLGFIVIKPLSQTIIGRTCLKTYNESTGKRFYTALRSYDVNLFGISLKINSLAFQEQDSVVAACATSALWSAFHATGILFQHSIPSPSAITESANKINPLDQRCFPNHGLTIEQMAHAISAIGLEPEPIAVLNDIYLLKASMYSYLSMGIPILLGGSLYNTENQRVLGKHAVCVSGFGFSDNVIPNESLPLKAEQISKIYVHDDQVGPFAKVAFNNFKVSIGKPAQSYDALSTHWQSYNHEKACYCSDKIVLIPEILLLPLYSKIRIPLESILKILVKFHEFIVELQDQEVFPQFRGFEWDIKLTTINKLKTDLLKNYNPRNSDIVRLLTKPCPRFLWRAKATDDSSELFELLFDATDLEQSGIFFDSISYDQTSLELISQLCRQDPIRSLYAGNAQYLLEELSNRHNL